MFFSFFPYGTALTLLYEQINKIKVQQSSGLDAPCGLLYLYFLLCNLFFMQQLSASLLYCFAVQLVQVVAYRQKQEFYPDVLLTT